jgi:hypothetical protein
VIDLDALLRLSNAQAVTTTAVSTNVIDTKGGDIGAGRPLYLVVQVVEDFADGTSLTVALQDSADNSSFAAVVSGPAILTADLTVGKKVVLGVPPGTRRYLRANYTVSGTMTAGKVTAYITDEYSHAPINDFVQEG